MPRGHRSTLIALAVMLAIASLWCSAGCARSRSPATIDAPAIRIDQPAPASPEDQAPALTPEPQTQPAEPPTPPTIATDIAASQPADGDDVRTLDPFEGVRVILDRAHPEQSRVEVQAWVCIEEGWLEQIACAPSTREHESLMVVKAQPSNIHAAVLMAGFEPGSPGRWTYENEQFGAIDPTGEKLDILVRYADPNHSSVVPSMREHRVGQWIRAPADGAPFPPKPWVFGGSRIEPNPEFMGPGEHYVADMTGSIIGLVTFGDETIGFSRVLADETSVQDPLWEANPETLPPIRTEVTIVIKRWRNEKASE